MKKDYLIILVVFIAIIVGYFGFQDKFNFPLETDLENKSLVYSNSKYGISFEYPDSYKTEEKEVGNSERSHYSITLLPKDYKAPEGGEGPTAVSIDIYQNNLDKTLVSTWITTRNESNFKLSNSAYSEINLDDKNAYEYYWDGLYKGHSIVLEHRENIVVISETYLDDNDPTRAVFQTVINSIKFSNNNLAQSKISDYLKKNISTLSPTKEVLGGKFYITDISLIDVNKARVKYEDGHNAFVAEVQFHEDEKGMIVIDSFTQK